MNKNYIIFSPVFLYGGVNLDVAFISDIILEKNNLKIISLGDLYSNSSIYLFNKNLNYNSLNNLIYKKDLLIKNITNLLCLIKPINVPCHFRVENKLTKSNLINIKKKKIKLIENEIKKTDVIFICSQLTSKYNKEIIEIASNNNKKIILKTTGQIKNNEITQENLIWLNKVDVFIHHSLKNKDQISNLTTHSKHYIIDQNAYFEDTFLKNKQKNKIKNFFVLSRLDNIKQIDIAIKAFSKLNKSDVFLNIYGDGKEEESLTLLSNGIKNINFKGRIDYKDIPNVFAENDCLLITSKFEAGPYTAIESMASGTPLISSKVGAMEERLPNYKYFFDGSEENLFEMMNKILMLKPHEIKHLSDELKQTYLKNYSENRIKNKYRELF